MITQNLSKTKIFHLNEKKTEIENCSFFTTLYIGSCSIRFQKKITSIFQKLSIVIKLAYTSKKVSDYFSNKSKCSEVLDASFIYMYTCSADQSISYIGETSRQVFHITDHCRTDKNSALFDHLFNCSRYQNFEILKRCKQSKL